MLNTKLLFIAAMTTALCLSSTKAMAASMEGESSYKVEAEFSGSSEQESKPIQNNKRRKVPRRRIKKFRSSFMRSKFTKDERGRYRYSSRLFRKMAPRRTQFAYFFALSAEDLSTARNTQAQTFGLGLGMKLKYRLFENLHFKTRGRFKYESGRTQDLFGDLEPDTGLYIGQAIVDYKPFGNYLSLRGGLVSQSFFRNPTFIKSLSFPGAKQAIYVNDRRWALGLVTQQLLPTSSTRSTRVQTREDTPKLFTESLMGMWVISKYNWVRLTGTWFDYDDLPAVVAFQSQRLGNNFNQGCTINNCTFLFGFRGWMNQVMFEQKISKSVSARFLGNFLRNIEAEDTFNESRTLSATLAIDTGRWIFMPRYETFFIEPEAVPALYNDWLRGHNNRIGWGGELKIESKDHNIRLGLTYYDAKLINQQGIVADGIQQDDLRTLFLSMETAYEGI